MVVLCSVSEAIQLEETSNKRFMEFYMRYCPSRFRYSPIKYYSNGKRPPKPATLYKTLHYIYKQFRCLFVHEGIKHLRPEDNIDVLFDKIEGEDDAYAIDLPKILDWLEKATFESLFAMLQLSRIYLPHFSDA